jgi:hypothetical protein
MDDILGGDMKWPHCRQSVIPSNVWNTEIGALVAEMDAMKSEAWWIVDTDLKYLTLRIDTRDNAFILTMDGRGSGADKIRIDPQRVMDAMAKYRKRFMKDNAKETP